MHKLYFFPASFCLSLALVCPALAQRVESVGRSTESERDGDYVGFSTTSERLVAVRACSLTDKVASQAKVHAPGEAPKSSDCEWACCVCEKQQELEKSAWGAYKGVFYDNNFDYLCDSCYDNWHLGEAFKQRSLGDWLGCDPTDVHDVGECE